MKIEKDISLKELNTFNVDVKIDTLCSLEKDSDFSLNPLEKYLDSFFVLGGGSNVLFSDNFKGCIFLIRNKGIEILEEGLESLIVKVQAGEEWEKFVRWGVKRDLLALHNLGLIPGTVGATPIQNVGAYGVEVKDLIIKVEILDISTGKTYEIDNKECGFGYRNSIFKENLKGKTIIKNVTFKLEKFRKKVDEKYIQYSGVKEKLRGKDLTPKNIYDAIVKIREEKLPSLDEYGSCGSTFKNPVIPINEYLRLLKRFPNIPKYQTKEKNMVKIPAAYILDRLGWKNRREGNIGTWISHPLIVTNYGEAKPSDILSFIERMQKDFKTNTGIELECEINII